MPTTRLKPERFAEKRREPRHLCAELVRVTVEGEAEYADEAVANLEEISPSGACVQLDRAVERGADIEIHCRQRKLRGKVRYCRFVGIGYDVGIEFNERGSWSRERFEPEHLLDVAELRRSAAAAEDWECA